MTERDRKRFFAKVDKNGPIPAHRPELGPCHVWTGRRHMSKGYGRFCLAGRRELAHRVSFYFANGRWPEPNALHHCDNTMCVNDAHLFEGTQADNNRDKVKKGRNVSHRGERNGSAKLTAREVRELYAEYKRGGVTQRELARRYGVCQRAVLFILKGQTWSHVSAGAEGVNPP